MFIGTDQEREIMTARERYWHDQASRVFEYKEQIRALEAEIRKLSLENEIRESKRKSIARMLRVRFNVPEAVSLVRLNEINDLATLERLEDYSADCKDYDSFWEGLANCNLKD